MRAKEQTPGARASGPSLEGRDLPQLHRLTRAEEWQRAQVWATWERHQAGESQEGSWDEIDRLFDQPGQQGPLR